jgi:hypothetical protein
VGTVPIFWGAPNIGEFFDTDGILLFETTEELVGILENITPELYLSMLPAIKNNLSIVSNYRVAEDWMYRHGVFNNL